MKSYALAAVLSSMMVTGSAFADNDFRALGQVSNLTPMSEEQLATVEGGWSGGGACGGGLINLANVCLNLALPVVVGINLSVLGVASQTIAQVTEQYIN
ncbi:hypothetical protein [Methylocaldum szegediense]|mgnify:CR=1 FL=1|uniref:Uncharacterized protein n=1 Tax=Methylocaldum szegediense TaxID=73780 RepID=A0ABM9I2M1_9GAMM|nr:hypothetical protein [Methylocaldum szegediense]CAI8849079.1 conserved exported protein of unknown function [Methylocaldum szegediense]